MMLNYAYLGHIPVTNARKIIDYFIGNRQYQSKLKDKWNRSGDDIETINLWGELHLLYARVADWHIDYEAICTMLILQSDGHIIQCEENTDDNLRVLKRGDVVRLNINELHRLISQRSNPDFFIALIIEPKKMTANDATIFFKYALKQLDHSI